MNVRKKISSWCAFRHNFHSHFEEQRASVCPCSDISAVLWRLMNIWPAPLDSLWALFFFLESSVPVGATRRNIVEYWFYFSSFTLKLNQNVCSGDYKVTQQNPPRSNRKGIFSDLFHTTKKKKDSKVLHCFIFVGVFFSIFEDYIKDLFRQLSSTKGKFEI